MSEAYLDDLFDQLVTAEPRPAWNDVLGRARHSRRRYGVLVAVAALFAAVPTAWAIDGAFFGSPPPPEIQSFAAFANEQAPIAVAHAAAAGWPDPGQYGTTADLSQLRGLMQVQTPDGPLDVWAAPSSNGGLCYFKAYESDLQKGDGGCTQPGGLANNSTAGEVESWHPDVYLTSGYTDNASATSATITLKVGENVLSETGPVVEGFYLIASPRDPSQTDAWDEANVGLEKVVTYDASGNEVETWENPWQIPCPKPAGQGPCDPRTP